MEMRLLSAALEDEIEAAQSETLELIKTLCRIPAPSHREERRAAFIREWLEVRGFSAEIDDAKNVRCGWGVEESGEIAVVMAHIDTVFPDLEPMPMREENGRLYCPGVGDDTANVAGMLILMDRMRRLGLRPNGGMLFVCNSCEEGLGNLKGCKAIMRDFAPRVKAFLSLDDQSTHVCARAVGSARYRITADTRGGHSFADFGARSAIEVLSRLTCALYRQGGGGPGGGDGAESGHLRSLNENLLRIARERANADRKLKPKKEHTGYSVVFSTEKEHRYGKGKNMTRVMLWETVIQSPYSIDLPEGLVRKQITDELTRVNEDGESLICRIGIDSFYPGSYAAMLQKRKQIELFEESITIGREDDEEPEKPKGENIMLRPYFRANFKAGYWEAVFFHTKPLGVVPADMRAR